MSAHYRLFSVIILLIIGTMMVFPPPAKAAGAPESGEQADMAAEPQADGAVRLSDDVTGSMKREAV